MTTIKELKEAVDIMHNAFLNLGQIIAYLDILSDISGKANHFTLKYYEGYNKYNEIIKALES